MRWARRTALISLPVLVAVSVAAPAMGSLSSRSSGVPSNLCTLKLAPQLKKLHVKGGCQASKTGKIGTMTIAGAHWGSPTYSIAITLYSGLPESRFKGQFGSLGTKVSLGSFAREASGPAGVTVSAWVSGVGLAIAFNHPASTAKNNAFRAPVFAFAKAVAKQI
jgi:hypothetical protein